MIASKLQYYLLFELHEAGIFWIVKKNDQDVASFLDVLFTFKIDQAWF